MSKKQIYRLFCLVGHYHYQLYPYRNNLHHKEQVLVIVHWCQWCHLVRGADLNPWLIYWSISLILMVRLQCRAMECVISGRASGDARLMSDVMVGLDSDDVALYFRRRLTKLQIIWSNQLQCHTVTFWSTEKLKQRSLFIQLGTFILNCNVSPIHYPR